MNHGIKIRLGEVFSGGQFLQQRLPFPSFSVDCGVDGGLSVEKRVGGRRGKRGRGSPLFQSLPQRYSLLRCRQRVVLICNKTAIVTAGQ